LAQEGQNFTRDDFQSFNDFCHQMGMKQCSYHRYQSGQSTTKDVMVTPPKEVQVIKMDSPIHLVKSTIM
jgi:hypothetical protein